jgi:sterol 3beta-glucosyltransferase
MRIAIVASGSRGDVQPYVGLGKGLKAAGHTVHLLTSDDFDELVSEAGLGFRSTGTSIELMLQSDEWRSLTESGNFIRILARMTAEVKRRANDLAQAIPNLFQDTDLIVTGMSGMGGIYSIAEKLNIPVIQAFVLPLTPTRAFPSPLTPSVPFGSLLNPVTFHVLRQMMWQSVRAADVTTRRTLKLPAASFWGPYRKLKEKRIPALYGFSQHVLPKPDDWDDLNHVTGYWFLEPALDWTPPHDLMTFLERGAPPVYVGFGSMGSRNPEETAQLTLKALELSGQRGVLASGWGGMKAADLPDTVFMLSSAPHTWLFPRMAAVVHHGGAGTTAAGLRAGVPSIIIPFFGDQPFWGKRIAELGVGPAPVPRRRLTAEKLADAITQAMSNATMRQRAAHLGELIRAEDGVGQAAMLIEKLSETMNVSR